MPLPEPRLLLLCEAARRVADRCGVSIEEAKAALDRAFREHVLVLFSSRDNAIHDWEFVTIDWEHNSITRRGPYVTYTTESVHVFRQHLDGWIAQAAPGPELRSAATNLRSPVPAHSAREWILAGIETEGRRMRVARLPREAQDAVAAAAWAAERARPMRIRQYFLSSEIADALARKPGRLEVDAAERARIGLDIVDWTSRGEFDLSGDSEVVTLISEPPYLVPLAPVRPGGILVNPEWLILRRHACRRYLLSSPLVGASQLLRDWFPEAAASPAAASSEPVPVDTGEPQPLTHAENGQTPARAGEPRPRAPDAEVRKWYEGTYIPECQTAGKRPSEAKDWAAAKLKFGDKVRREQIRDLRRALAPDDWRIQGRRPSSTNSAENSAE